MDIYLVSSVDNKLAEAFKRLIPQLSETARIPDVNTLFDIVDSGTTRLFVVEEEKEIVASACLVIYEIPTIRKAWIEDVVVDSKMRGRGIAATLIEYILDYAKEKENLDKVDLTSNIKRIAAHRLYKKLGFEERDSTMFRKEIK